MVRIKHRYLLLSIHTPTSPHPTNKPTSSSSSTLHSTLPLPLTLTPTTLLTLLRTQISLLYGDHGLGTTAAGLKIIYLSPATATAIVRCPRASYRIVWAACAFVTSLDVGKRGERDGRGGGRGCVIRVMRVSGTIRKVEEEAVRRARREIVRVKMEMLEGGEGGAASLGGAEGVRERVGEEEGGIEDLGEDDEDEDEDMDSESG